ncbi:MAG: glycosyltransferase family 2 protein [Bacteroidetes bacterium]|nr:glycosyltransferase family 2 protein [Bacteroidota bacterium]
MDVSVIIVNYNTTDQLCVSVESVITHTELINYEIIVVDNSKDDKARGVLEERFQDKVRYLGIHKNIGFGKANNEGLRYAKGRNILFLNPDTILLNNALLILSDFLDNNPSTGMAGGNLYNRDLNPAYSFRQFRPSLFWELNELFFSFPENLIYRKNKYFNHSSVPMDVAYITGADVMIPRRILEITGSFDPSFFLYFEETDLAHRVRKAGYNIKNVPQARIIHLEGTSFRSGFERHYNFACGKINYYKKNKSRVEFIVMSIISMFTIYARIMFFWVLSEESKLKEWQTIYKSYLEACRKVGKNRNIHRINI